ncbi:ral guanine nucleotide dissociation stimulator-like [Peromyscus eremicus]|uniref:ral guanine nucleotide dissociation stimulator-like n=1 Tax=Peromyscus eremicus TaxID=42410 RepID=UPI0027DC21DF|nr:ral guanine nucleotide dissociation stimulator-like [Peromyscus eremicus]
MFSCCLGITRGSDHKKEKRGGHGGGHGGTRRSRVHSWLQRLWPFGRRGTNSTQGSQGQDHTDQVEKESAPKDLKKSYRKSRFSALEEVVIHLVISLQTGDPSVVLTFIYIYQRYAYFYPDCEEDEEVMGAISTLLDIRIEKFPEDFCQASVLSILKQVKNYLIVNIPHSDVVIRVNELLTQLQAEVASDSEASTEEASEMPASAAHP